METVISQNTDKQYIFRLFKTDVKVDYFHFGYQRNTIRAATIIYFAISLLYETKFKSKFDCPSQMN